MLLVTIANFATGYVTLARQHVNPFHFAASGGSFTFHEIAGNAVVFLLDYSLVYSLTVILGGELKGVGASMAIVLGLPAIGALVRLRWNIALPTDHVPFVFMTIGALVLALLLVVSAQAFVNRVEF